MGGHLLWSRCPRPLRDETAHLLYFARMRWIVLCATLPLQALVLQAQFANEHSIAPLERISDLLTGDVDNNGTTDLVSCGLEGPILLYRGSGDGAFLPPETIAIHGYLHFGESGLVDADGDQDLDVLYHDDFDAVRLLRNDGSGIFGAPEVAFPLITEGVNNGMHFRDLDGDGDVDIVFSRDNVNHNQIVWYANNGSGAFTFVGIVASTTNSAYWILPADVDGDGCAESVAVVDGTVTAGGLTLQLTIERGDLVRLGDWACQGRTTVAVLRRGGRIEVFDEWATPAQPAVARVVLAEPISEAEQPVDLEPPRQPACAAFAVLADGTRRPLSFGPGE